MARKRASASKSNKMKYIAWAVMLLTTSGGSGGYLLKDHPLLAGVIQAVLGDVSDDKSLKEAVAARIKEAASTRVGGRFEVKITAVELGAELAEARRAPSLHVVVKRQDPDGYEDVLWQSPARTAKQVVGNGPWTIDLSEDPFRVDWKPGDQLTVEVVHNRGVRKSTTFVMASPKVDTFPMARGEHTLKMAGVETPSGKNKIVFEPTRLGNLAADATAVLIDRVPNRR
jgi:hypothetical protein